MALLIIVFISIHLLELAGYLIYVQSKKNDKLEKMVTEQDSFIDSLSSIIRTSRHRLDELDSIGAFRSDDELGVFFSNLRNIQEILDGFTAKKGDNRNAS